MEEEGEQHGFYEIEMRDGLELRYHSGEPGNWVGVESAREEGPPSPRLQKPRTCTCKLPASRHPS